MGEIWVQGSNGGVENGPISASLDSSLAINASMTGAWRSAETWFVRVVVGGLATV